MSKVTITCPECKGNGTLLYIGFLDAPCWKCLGTGEIEYKPEKPKKKP